MRWTGRGEFLVALTLISGVACSRRGDGGEIVYTDVVPILSRHCSGCHRSGGSGPFALVDYRNAAKYAGQIADVIQSGYMPPWLPDHSDFELAGDRRLSPEEVDRLLAWVRAGSPPGDPARHPAPPGPAPAWLGGTPDLVLELPAALELPATGRDVYRNFLLPDDVRETRWVRAVEFRTDSPRLIHHARILADRSGVVARLEAADPRPGYGGMDTAAADSPDGILIGWTPGKAPATGDDGLAWRFDAATDVVVQLHMVPSGKPERITASLGLHFADRPPTRRALSLVLGSRDIDMPPGTRDYAVADAYELPVAVDVLGVYPHAHYLATSMELRAIPPDAETLVLLRIDEWDFDWQDEYRFVRQVRLSAGTTLRMDYRYDNSDENVRNPNFPARRVRYGPRTEDEMAEAAFQVVPVDAGDHDLLQAHYERHLVQQAVDYRRRRIASGKVDVTDHAALGAALLRLGDSAAAADALRQALAMEPGDAAVSNNLGYALLRSDRPAEAVPVLRQAVAAGGGAATRFNLGEALRRSGHPDAALDRYREALRLQPDTAGPLGGIARILVTHPDPARRDPAEALRLARRAVELTGGTNPEILETLVLAEAATAGSEF